MPLVLRGSKGFELDWDELDGNFTYLNGLIADKAAAVHSHAIADVAGLQVALNGKAPTGHIHTISGVDGLQVTLDAKQPIDPVLTALAELTVSSNSMIYSTGVNTFATSAITAFGRSLIDDADASAARSTLGLGSIATQAANNVTISGGSISGLASLTVTANSSTDGLRITQTGAGNALVVEDAASPDSSPFVIDSTGNVGVGTSSPSVRLDIHAAGTSPGVVAEFGNGSISGGLQVLTSDGNLEWGFNAINSRSLVFQTNQTERLRISGTGAITQAIGGTLTTGGPITVRTGDGGVEGGQISLNNKANTQAAYTFDVDGGDHGRIFTTLNNTNLSIGQLTGTGGVVTIHTGAAERLRISSGGNVVIGTAAIAAAATEGFIWIPSCAGAPSGSPTPPYTNAAALVVDTTNSRLYVRVGSTWKYASLT